MNPNISVVIPLYNHEDFILEAIQSVQHQTTPVFEIIIIDDGSKDNSGKIAIEEGKNDVRIKYLYQENAGAHNAINRGIKMATGDYVAILNSDDVYPKERFERMIGVIENTNAEAIFSGIDFIDAKGKKVRNEWYNQAKDFYLKNNNYSLALMNGNFFMTTSNTLIRRDVFDKIGFFYNLRYTHDQDFFLRLFLHNINVQFIDEPLLFYRSHATNTINEDHMKVRMEWAAIIALFVVEHSKKTFSKPHDCLKDNMAFFKIVKKHSLTKYVLFFIQFYLCNQNSQQYYDELTKPDLVNFIKNTIK